ncbi:MAG: Co2+/Mg2+ efflux protein ApaG [Turneriella sp.]|nr:Co2+/Mg2+ efflux protein ApaG [Turneriella sp.]
MPQGTGSEIVTEGIRVIAEPRYLPEQSSPEDNQYLFTYRITLINEGTEWVKLKSRHWIIIDGDGRREDVYGPGVVGQEPELEPGQSYSYSSFCPLRTNFGTMEGSFSMIRRDGTPFEVRIARFYLTTEG